MHDFVIVGAGSAGCTLAARLTEDPGTKVMLIEAGGRDRSLNIKIPAAFAKQFRTKLDWDLDTEPEPHCEAVMPTITSGNTNAPTIMIAERAADLIRSS